MTRARSLLAAALVFTATGIGTVLAQTDTEGLDIAAIQARAQREAAAFSELVGHALASQAQRGDAQATVDTAKGKLGESAPRAGSGRPAPGGLDLDDLVAQSSKMVAPAPPAPAQFYAFASLSMPPEALKGMIDEVSRAGGTVVFRGFPPQGAGAFMKGLSKVIPEGTPPRITIDPRLFKAFQVEAVPTYVTVAPGFTPCSGENCSATAPAFDRLSGNVTALFAAEMMADGNGPGAPAARAAALALKAVP